MARQHEILPASRGEEQGFVDSTHDVRSRSASQALIMTMNGSMHGASDQLHQPLYMLSQGQDTGCMPQQHHSQHHHEKQQIHRWIPAQQNGRSGDRRQLQALPRKPSPENSLGSTFMAHNISPDAAPMDHSNAQSLALQTSFPVERKENIRASDAEAQSHQAKANGPPNSRRPLKINATSQANDQELRRLFQENRQRSMKDIAISVLENERGPKAEKSKQIFAMKWLSQVCRKADSSVPRNRVYAHYAQCCGTERVPLLNPASFGKLVRIIFPDIQTRRLGMRGESKYHYVDLELLNEQSDPMAEEDNMNHTLMTSKSARTSLSSQSQAPAETADFPSPRLPPTAGGRSEVVSHKEADGLLFLNREDPRTQKGPSRQNMIGRKLKFPVYSENEFPDDAPIQLPDIQPHLPPGTDEDVAIALKALYRSHCVSVIDCVRYCKEKPFWHHFTAFHGTLTVPVQRLFAHPAIAPWIQKCDWLMYQKMIQFVSPLALQVVPDPVTAVFQSISDNLGQHILDVFGQHSAHVRDAKHGPAIIFAGLLGRLLRVNAASHAAAHILGNDAMRNQMWHDWVHHVKPPVVVETCLPGVGYSRTIQILTHDIRNLLSPLSMTSYPGMQQIYRAYASELNSECAISDNILEGSTSSVLDRWITFLHTLPSRFPGADARTLLHCVSDVGTAALRDITMATAVSFGQWTVTKVWVDEMMQWLAEKGGFLENAASSAEMRPQKRNAESTAISEENPKNPKRASLDPQCGQGSCARTKDSSDQTAKANSSSTTGADSLTNSSSLAQQSTTVSSKAHSIALQSSHSTVQPSFQDRPTLNTTTKTDAVDLNANYDAHDDSAIGLDADTPQRLGKPSSHGDYVRYVAGHFNSDPADVVVC